MATYRRPFDSAERDITEADAQHVLTILGGPSPWRSYLQNNLAARRSSLPAKPMRICDENEFVRNYHRIHGERPPVDAQGFVDRRNGTMILKEFPARNYGKTKVGLALHEAVHLFSHPPGKSNQIRGTAYSLLGQGLLEGLTQNITDDILVEQGILPMRERWQAYLSLTPIARKFARSFSPLVAEAYFNGAIAPLFNAIQTRWTMASFQRLVDLANQKQTGQALQLIDGLNRPRVTQFQQVFRMGGNQFHLGEVPNPDNLPTQPLSPRPPQAPMPTNPVVPREFCPELNKVKNFVCYPYANQEIAVSWSEVGHLTPDVVLVQPTLGLGMLDTVVSCKYLIIRDFGVDWRHLKDFTKNEQLLKDWLLRFETDNSLLLRIVGYSDCVGPERSNLFLRNGRAQNVLNLMGPRARARVMTVGASPDGTYLTDNSTVAGRASNRAVVIQILTNSTKVI